MDKKRLLLQAYQIERVAKEAEELLLQGVKNTNIIDYCYTYKSRVKSADKLVNKVDLKVEGGKDSYTVTSITDVVGIRFVTLFRKDMPDVVSKVLDLISHNLELSPNPFCKNSLEEGIGYHVPHISDPVISEVEECFAKSDFKKEYTSKDSAEYSSIHMVARINKKVDSLEGGLPKEYYIPVEIQVRTVFEDAWGEIDHKYGYTIRTGKMQGSPTSNLDSVKSHLKVLKKFTDAAAEYADVIYRDAIGVSKSIDVSGNVISVGDDEELINSFKDLKVPAKKIKSYVKARQIRREALSREQFSDHKLKQAADIFKNIVSDITIDSINRKNNRDFLLYYYVKMNEAFCLLSCDAQDSIFAAKLIYESLKALYDDFPLLHHRLGWVYAKLGLFDDAIGSYKFAMNKMNECIKNQSVGSSVLPTVDFEHMAAKTGLLLGYTYWIKADGNPQLSLEKKINLFELAYKVTSDQVEGYMLNEPQQFSMHNNCLYYLIELVEHISVLDKNRSVYIDQIKAHLNSLDKLVDSRTADLDYLDTLSKAFFLIKDYKQAIRVAKKIIEIGLNESNNQSKDTDVLTILKEAHALIGEIERLS